MRTLFLYFSMLLIPAMLWANPISGKNKNQDPVKPGTSSETEQLLSYLESNGNFMGTGIVEAVISADEVKKNLKNEKYHLIDIRSESWFDYGHIKGANNVSAEQLPDHFSTIDPGSFDKIVLICYSGQSASYYASLLRLAGHPNVYSMKWGMSSWREDFAANSWSKNVSDVFADKLEQTKNEKPANGNYPTLNTGKSTPEEILKARLETLFNTPYKDFIVEAKDVFENPDQFYVLNYTIEPVYTFGHIKGAVLYEPLKSLLSTTDLATLPTDKKIVVYDETGLHAAYVTAYLNLLGYEVGNLAYGNNGFMNKELSKHNWQAFTPKEINMFPVVE